MKHIIKKLALFPTLVMTAHGALAQDTLTDPDAELQPELRSYTVEMIIFSYAQSVSAGTEIFVADLPPPLELTEDELVFGDSVVIESIPEVVEVEPAEETLDESAEDPLTEEDIRYAITMLPEADFELIDIAERLDRLDAYEPLMHFGWTQPTYPDEEPETRPLSSFVTPPDGLVGDLSLYLSRYLHLSVKLQLDAPGDGPTGAEFGRNQGRDTYSSFSDQTVSYPVRYRIDEDRIFKNGDLRYFDHPKFGVIAKIMRVEEEEVEEPEDEFENGEMLGDMELIDADVE